MFFVVSWDVLYGLYCFYQGKKWNTFLFVLLVYETVPISAYIPDRCVLFICVLCCTHVCISAMRLSFWLFVETN